MYFDPCKAEPATILLHFVKYYIKMSGQGLVHLNNVRHSNLVERGTSSPKLNPNIPASPDSNATTLQQLQSPCLIVTLWYFWPTMDGL